ncbi:methyltransferase domain-containing protein [Gordonia sp. HNM0687]|uniref:Methyltransferase domain-containing protein n=1 Tax=Gordonia mangrovi TaxID=2665643 RepID=A0A6L7GWC5_9ACTN|nr:class I SAM-dependent methyltransferase [Gordonia mangrovi]MXP24276.1 methyltransferase domain-containing protein [Gordonia mangrovi]UVF79905.1 class I SAM-dependent methyltransferase [Gordonia mangrovi]
MVDWDGARYADVSALQRMVAEASIRDIELTGDERLLDVGCGDGFITMRLAERLPNGSVVGVDASRRMIERALTRVPPDWLRVQFHVDDVLALPFERDFDIAVSFNALHWVRDQTAALTQIAHSLDDGGRAVIQQVCETERPSIEDVAMDVASSARWRDRFTDFPAPFIHVSPEHFAQNSRAAGFVVADLGVDDLQWQFESVDDFTQWFAVGATAWTHRLPDDRASSFASDVIDRYQEMTGQPALFRFGQLRATLTLPST